MTTPVETAATSNSVANQSAGTATPSPAVPNAGREHIVARYQAVRGFSDTLREPLMPEDCVIQSMPDASPTKWHLAHTSWFFETFVLKPGLPGYRSAVPEYAFLFNSYYNAVGAQHQRDQRGMISRPTLAETARYRQEVDGAMDKFFAEVSEAQWQKFASVVEIGLHHEQQHQELLLTDIKHVFAQNPLYPIYRERESLAEANRPAPALQWITFPEGIYEIGQDPTAGFSFDNEGPRHREFLEAFRLGSRLVTCGEYLEFMTAGGYQRPEWWLSLGWGTAKAQGWRSPFYWEEREDGRWFQFTLSGMRPVVESEPVCHVSFFEADAFARWAGARLPTEAEWEVACAASDTTPKAGDNFVENGRYHPVALSNRPEAEHPAQIFGDVWDWTRSAYAPYPGYAPAAGALGEYNGKFMCNQYVLRGGSCATSRTHIRETYRNFFPPDKRWQFSGIRLANDIVR